MACGMLASCGSDESSSESKAETSSSSVAETTTTTAESKEESSSIAKESSAVESEADSTAETKTEPYEPQTEFKGYDAFLMFGDSSWMWGNWQGSGVVNSTDWDKSADNYGYGVDADVVGDGEYTVSITRQSILGNETYTNSKVIIDDNGNLVDANGVAVMCVDIIGICDGTKNSKGEDVKKNALTDEGNNKYDIKTKGDYTGQELKAEVTSIKCDGKEIEFDPSKIITGNLEPDNNRYRIEIYNTYGDTSKSSGIDPSQIAFSNSLEVTFKIEGLGEVKSSS